MEPEVIDLKSFFFTSEGNLVLKLPQSTALAVLQKMLYLVFLFSFGSKYFLFFLSPFCFLNTLLLFFLWLTGYLEECCFFPQIFGTCSHVFLLLVINLISLKSEANFNPFKIIDTSFMTNFNCLVFPFHSFFSTLRETPGLHLGPSSWHCSLETFSRQQVGKSKCLPLFLPIIQGWLSLTAWYLLLAILFVCFLGISSRKINVVPVISSWLQVHVFLIMIFNRI